MQHYVSNVFQFKKQVSKKNKTVQADNAQGSSASQGHRTAAMHELETQGNTSFWIDFSSAN